MSVDNSHQTDDDLQIERLAFEVNYCCALVHCIGLMMMYFSEFELLVLDKAEKIRFHPQLDDFQESLTLFRVLLHI